MSGLRVGVLGCSSFALRRMLPAMRAATGIEPVAVASRTAAKAERAAAGAGVRAVTGYQALLDLPGLDAVYVPLPAGLHAEWVERALLAGKHVLAEKPLTTSYRDTARLMRLAGERGLVLAENFMFRHHPQHRRIRDWIKDGELGPVHAFHGVFGIPPRPAGDVRLDPALGGGALLDVGVYPLRAARLLLGEPLTVVGASLRRDAGHGVDVHGSALLRTPSGITVTVTFGLGHAYQASYDVWGGGGRTRAERAYTPPPEHVARLRLDRQDLPPVETEVPPADQAVAALESFAAAIAAGGLDPAERRDTVAHAALVDEVMAAAGEARP
ncbi:Gfo/Idh/MocA family oxidoreductase [Actinomadura sp. ATCC 31491]|uniref:Gfo/Idh/MocA family oxidoreductase n=1 Tax=Actinomadura luzonensis TaxID=2805427 RepID=A0ABT0G909_9ACTN|nr:Gfo/Idh/MocA family oxidoreductase [Actinomadura luzonensis]MCK2221080.1 Gfo/Idh/MocA family oxidoreductase [Actinomadura luzonensis]